MKLDEAAKTLRKMYDRGMVAKEQVTQVHLFGIIYADELAGVPLSELLARAEMPDTYKTEIRKGMKLARYVRVIE